MWLNLHLTYISIWPILTPSLSKPYTNSSVPVTQEYFNNEVLSKSSGIEDYGSLRIRLVACAIFCWFVIYACIFKGAKVMGKVVYLTVIVPYFLLIVMLIRGLTLEGAIIGIEYFLGENSKESVKWNQFIHEKVTLTLSEELVSPFQYDKFPSE